MTTQKLRLDHDSINSEKLLFYRLNLSCGKAVALSFKCRRQCDVMPELFNFSVMHTEDRQPCIFQESFFLCGILLTIIIPLNAIIYIMHKRKKERILQLMDSN